MHNNIYTRIVSGIAAAVMTLTNITPLSPMRAEEDYYPEHKKASATDTIVPSTAPVTESFCGPTESPESTEEAFCGPTECTEETTELFCGPMQVNPFLTEETTVWAEEDLSHQSIELYPNGEEAEQVVSLEGLMPEGVTAEVVDVSETHEGIAAYDITIKDGWKEYQPGEKHPILVEITDPVIADVEYIELWHIMDDGTREQIFDFTLEDGTVSFYATGFSVYEIVESAGQMDLVWHKIESLADFEAHASTGIYIGHISGYYASNEQYDINSTRTGIRKSQPANASNPVIGINTTDTFYASPFYFEQTVINNAIKYKMYCYQEKNKKYVQQTSKSLKLGPAASATPFEVTNPTDRTDEDIFIIVGSNGFCWNMQGGTSGLGFAAYDILTDNNAKLYFWYHDPLPSDPYHLNGKTYALMYYTGGNTGNGLYANSNGDPASAELLSWVVRNKAANNTVTTHTYYVAEDVDLSTWMFHSIEEDRYSLSTTVGSTTKYLHIDETTGTLSLSDTAQAITVTPNNQKSIMLSVGNKAVTFQPGSGDTSATFTCADKGAANQYLKLVNTADLQNNDYVTYSAKKVSVSSGENGTKNGDDVLIYTRIWQTDHYEFFAVGGDGTLYPCYERGDNIMWVGGRIDTLLWEFTEYTYDDGSPNYYYELYNPYTQKYIAPKRKINDSEQDQVISDSKIGINLPGRKQGEYYTDILAWDDPSYSYSGLGTKIIDAEHSTTVPTNRHNADTFYFAKIIDPATTLTVVDTIDNNEYGITMRMVDWKQEALPGGQKGKTQSIFLGSDSGGSGSALQQNLLSTDLGDDDYPKTALESSKFDGYQKGRSLYDLFNAAELVDGTYKAREVNHLFIKSTYEATGYFEFDSCQNTATLVPNGGAIQSDFVVYKELATDNTSTMTTHDHGQFFPFNYILPGVYSPSHPTNLYDALAKELPESDPRKYEKLHQYQTGNTPNCYNGMELTASFTQTPSGKDNWNHDIIFEFTGDDDFWLYVDGELVIDLGGIHSAVPGNVNFATGVVVNNGTSTTLRDVFIANYKKRNPSATNAEIEAFLREKHFGEISGVAATAAPKDKFEPIFDDYTKHTMRIFYMERGAGASNLHMRFNLSYVTPGNVILKKEITGTDDLDYESVEYPFQILYRYQNETTPHYLGDTSDASQNQYVFITYQNSTKTVDHVQSYTPPGGTTPYKSVFFINPINSAEIHFPENTYEYQIIECGMNTDVYDWTKINGVEPVIPDPNDPDPTKPEKEIVGDRVNYKSAWTTVEQQTNVTFNNNVDPDGLRTLTFRKKLFNANYRKYSELSADEKAQYPTKESWEEHCKLTVIEDPTKFSFRLYLSNGVSDDVPLANMVKYRVLDPDGYYCKWDSANQEFVRYQYQGSPIHGKTALESLLSDIANDNTLTDKKKATKEALLEPMTFESSMNGQISKIQAWYFVEVPNLPSGTKFKVEERDAESERPLGFDRVEYEREEGTYVNGDEPGTGTIRKEESPKMSVVNQRGFEIQATKVWSDADFTKSHDDIYTALYVGDIGTDGKLTNLELVTGSIRKLENGNGSSRHFLPALESGRTLANYAVYEVTLTNPGVDSNGNITYDTITPLGNGVPTSIGATPASPEGADRETFSYTVNYEYGEPIYNAANENNARSDTITNDRGGGVVISLFDMALNSSNKHDPLANGLFTLKQGETAIGTYRSNSNGKITIMYDFQYDVKYTLIQTTAPEHYIGLPEPLTFELQKSGTATEPVYNVLFGNSLPEKWRDVRTQPGDEIVAYIDVYNTQFTLKAVKVAKPEEPNAGEEQAEPEKLAGAKFALYRALKGVGGYVKDYEPMTGFENLTTDDNGVIPKIDNQLVAGRYFLCEVTPPNGYKVLEHDIAFQIADHDIELLSSDPNVELSKSSESNRYNCQITIQNVPDIQNYYFDIEKNIFVDKNIHASDSEQKFVFKILQFDEGTPDAELKPENAKNCFYVTMNCTASLPRFPYPNVLQSGKYSYDSYDSNTQMVSVKHSNDDTDPYRFPAAIYQGRKIVHVTSPGIYLVSEVEEWSATAFDFWIGSNTYRGYADGGTSTNMGHAVKMIVTAKNMEYDSSSLKTDDRPTASFTNSETEYAYLSSQAYAQNTIKRN